MPEGAARRGARGLLLVLGLLASGDGVAGCAEWLAQRAAMKNASYSLIDVDITSLSPAGAELRVELGVENPNEIDAVLDTVSFDLFVNGHELAKGTTSSRLVVPPKKKRSLKVGVDVPLSSVPALAKIVAAGGTKNYKVVGTAFFATPLGKIPYPLEVSGRFR